MIPETFLHKHGWSIGLQLATFAFGYGVLYTEVQAMKNTISKHDSQLQTNNSVQVKLATVETHLDHMKKQMDKIELLLRGDKR